MSEYTNLPERKIFIKAKESCKTGDLNTLQALIGYLMFEEHNNYGYDLLYEAGIKGHLNIVKYLFEDPYLSQHVNFPDYIDGILMECCDSDHPNIISYLINEKWLDKSSRFEEICMSEALKAAKYGKLNILKVLIHPNKDKSSKADMLLSGGILSSASEHGHIDIIKYLLESPELKNYRYSMNYNLAFKSASLSNQIDIIKYFIFDKNIKLDEELKHHFTINPNNSVMKLFELKEINQQLNSELGNNQTTNKKVKI